MNRRTVEIALVAVVAVLVISIAASTLDSTVSSGDGSGFGGGNGSSFLPEISTNQSGTLGDASLPREPMIVLAVIGILLAIWYLIENPRDALALIVGAAVLFGGLFLFLWFIKDLFGGPSGQDGDGFFGGASGGSEGSGTTGALLEPQSIELVAILVLGLVFVGVVLSLSGREFSEPPEAEDEPDDSVDVGAIARAAGRAADRIAGDAQVDNEVYRAWREMTDLLDVPDPETSTAREFADAAVEAGLDPDDVEELTVLFEEVRYGAEEPTGEREERAIAALRRIESTYGEA